MLESLSLFLAQRLLLKKAFPPKLRTRRVKARERAAATPPEITVPPPDSSKLYAIASLPHKDGKIDMEQYSKYKNGGLRQKLHDAIRARK